MMKYKFVIKSVAQQYGKTVTFMPKPIFGDNGSGMHTHQSLWTKNKPLFAGDKYAGLSQLALWYAGGLLKHGRSISAFIRADHELLQAPGARLRSSGEPGLLQPQSLRRGAHPDVFGQPESEAAGVPAARSFVQRLSHFRGHADGRPRRHREQDRSRQAARRGHLRTGQRKKPRRCPPCPARSTKRSRLSQTTTSISPRAASSPKSSSNLWIEYKTKNEADPVRMRPHPYEFHLYYDI